MLRVYKASAGSGKTFQLVVEYLQLLIENPNNYRHILAVTFTNKATNEMKSRILEQLYLLAGNKESAYLEILRNNNKHSEEFIRKRAKLILKNILHDYNRFSISTIDSFTQRVIKSFNRELGITPNFTLELDSVMILEEAVDRMLSKIDKNRNLLKWLKDFSKEKIEESKSQRIDENIKALGEELIKEKFQIFFPENSESIYNHKNIDSFSQELKKIKNNFESTIYNLGEDAIKKIYDNGFTINDFTQKNRGVAKYFKTLSSGTLIEPNSYVLAAEADTDKWFPKTSPNAAVLHILVTGFLHPLLVKLLNFYRKNAEQYYTAVVILKQLRMLGILTDLKEEIKALLHEKGILQISDSNLLLNKIIAESDSPFIYEKTGSFFHHFMLDEFQDTSTLQWKNFKPLVENSLAEGNSNLIVGDVKQSIYRWRNSDWKILAEYIYSDFTKEQINEEALDKNWRSEKNIIDFNNGIFSSLIDVFEEKLISTLDDDEDTYSKKFRNIYNSYIQKPGKKTERKGYVKVSFVAKEDSEEESANLIIEDVKRLQDNGISASGIAILIRNNKDGIQIIKSFMEAAALPENSKYNLSVVSNDSMFLSASKGVQFVIQVIELLINPDNAVTRYSLLNLWINWLKPALQNNTVSDIEILNDSFDTIFETELTPVIDKLKKEILLTSLDETIIQISSQFGIMNIQSELPFIQTLTDKAGELKSTLLNDMSNLILWWNEKGYKTSVNVNEQINAIRIITVHSSKGLEFDAVLIPKLDWQTGHIGNMAPIIWCSAKTEPFNKLPLLPVVLGSNMGKSIFKKEYTEEKIDTVIDTLNLIYVAFTRAKSVLIVNSSLLPDNSKSKTANVMLKDALEILNGTDKFRNSWNTGHTVFEYGSIPQFGVQEDKTRQSVFIKEYHFNNFNKKIKLRTSAEHIADEEKEMSVKDRGKIIHDILSRIETEKDIETSCNKALNEGIINETEHADILTLLHNGLKNETVKEWFGSNYHIVNERSLLSSDRVLRPDRIMISDREVVVVDYKTGSKTNNKYNRQVKHYSETIKKTTNKKVTGYLWYINLNIVERVCKIEA